MTKQLMNTNGESLGEISLAKEVFGVEPNLHVMHLALRRQLNNARQGSASAKTRAEVSGGGRKPWKQKGTGRARAGSTRSPLFAGGGVITGGPTSGDKILARVNAGEMILNKGQQTNLFNALDSGNFGRSGNSNVTIGFDRVLGSDIYLSLKNYMKSTGKKL